MTDRDEQSDGRHAKPGRTARKFLSVWFQCCHVYGRMYRDQTQTIYQGHCPRCGSPVRALIGPSGTNQRIFRAQ